MENLNNTWNLSDDVQADINNKLGSLVTLLEFTEAMVNRKTGHIDPERLDEILRGCIITGKAAVNYLASREVFKNK